MIIPVNYLAVLVATVVAFAIGGFWYSPMGFGKQWMKARGMDPSVMKGMSFPTGLMVQEFIATLVMAFVISQFVGWLGVFNALGGLVLGLWLWVGFIVPVFYGAMLWEKMPSKLFLINAGLRLVNIVLMAVIIGVWR